MESVLSIVLLRALLHLRTVSETPSPVLSTEVDADFSAASANASATRSKACQSGLEGGGHDDAQWNFRLVEFVFCQFVSIAILNRFLHAMSHLTCNCPLLVTESFDSKTCRQQSKFSFLFPTIASTKD